MSLRAVRALGLAILVAGALAGAGAGIASATAPTSTPSVTRVVLPRDHGAHPGFGEEWWYTTGTVTAAGRSYFWFATIWSAQGAMLAKVNVVDLRSDSIVLSHEYVSSTPPSAGQTQLRVGSFALGRRAGGPRSPWIVNAPVGPDGLLHLTLTPRQPYVLNGHHGIIQQGTGGASAYYSDPRLAARGTLQIYGTRYAVTGQGWFDHQWGNFGNDLGALKWNWFACQFDNGSDLMLYQFLNAADRPTGRQTATFVSRTGAVSHPTRFTITPLSPSIHPTGAIATYPLRWRVRVPADGVNLTLRARARNSFIANQLIPGFWEAASAITSGTRGVCTVESSREFTTAAH